MRVMKICILQIHDSKYILNWDQYNVLDNAIEKIHFNKMK